MTDLTMPAGDNSAGSPNDGLPTRYRVDGPLAGGGQGVVHAAFDTRLDREIAIKVMYEDGALTLRAKQEIHWMSRLQHRGIVAVYDQGKLDDGRLWFAMRRVRGRLLGAWAAPLRTPVGTLHADGVRSVVAVVEQICRTVGYAHGEGVVHGDIKPANIMVEALETVQVLDWGVARAVGEVPKFTAADVIRIADGRAVTHTHVVLGTPHYMAPEQVQSGQPVLPAADVYAVGVVLYELLTGRRPYTCPDEEVLRRLPRTPPPTLSAVLHTVDRDQTDLIDLVERAMARRPAERQPDCLVFADQLAEWIRTFEARRDADDIVARCEETQRQLDGLSTQQAEAARQALAHLSAVAPHQPAEAKVAGWALEDEAARLAGQMRGLRLDLEQRLHSALNRDRQHPSAHRLLAALYRARAEEAESTRQHGLAAEFTERVAHHDRGEHRAWCAGTGRLSLTTRPAGARVTLHRVRAVERRLEPRSSGIELGVTPLLAVPVNRGAYVARIAVAGAAPVTYPVWIERAAHWQDRDARGRIVAVDLEAAAAAPADTCFVPAGWFRSGGDPEASDALPAAWRWTDAFLIQRFAVTHRRYLAFINDLAKTDAEAALRHCPRQSKGIDSSLLYRESAGVFALEPGERGDPDMPVTLIDWHSATAFARWQAEQTGRPWRLLHSLEREKAARGVSGRLFPWGDAEEPSYTNMSKAHASAPVPTVVDSFPTDESVYGVRGLAGNVRDWCGDFYGRDGGQSPADSPAAGDYMNVRGGSFTATPAFCRLAGRFAERPASRMSAIGIRLACSVGAGDAAGAEPA